jgi:hypothetical protein
MLQCTPQGDKNMRHKLFQTVIVSMASLSVAGVLTAQTGDRLRIPAGFQHWYLVNSLLVTKDSPQFDTTGGLHHVYVNDIGLARLKKGGSAPYPDGTVFADDVREFTLFDGEYTEGKRKAIPVMLKDSKKYRSTGGWGFQAWAEGDRNKPLVTDPVKSCFGCHTPQKANDYLFSTYLH